MLLTAQLELFPTYHAIGVNLQLPVADPEEDAVASLKYGSGPADLQDGFRLSRVNNELHQLSGSVFWRLPGTVYFVRVEIQDPSTPALDGLIFEEFTTTIPNPVYTSPIAVYYVHPEGSGAVFSQAQPGKLQDALNLVEAGEQVVLLGGIYYVGDLSLANSGAADAPIRIEGAPGQTAVLDGAQASPPVWSPVGASTLYATTSAALNPNLVVADGVRLYPQGTLEDLVQDKITVGFGLGPISFPNVYDGFFRNPSNNPILNSNWQYPKLLYVKFHDGSDPNDKDMIVTAQRKALTLEDKSHIQLKNLTFRHYGRAPAPVALEILNSEHILVDSCHFAINDVGILLGGASDRITIQHTEFSDAMPPWNAWRIKATYDDFFPNSSIFPFYGRMLEKGGILYQHGFSGRGTVIRNCNFHDYGQAGHVTPPSVNPDFELSYEIDFYENTVYNCFEDGLEADGISRNTRIWDNVFHHTNAAISTAAAREGPTYFLRNIFHHLVTDTFLLNPIDGKMSIEGHPFKFQYGDDTAEIGDIYFFHNTVYSPSDGFGMDHFEPARCIYFEARNNLFETNTGYPFYVATKHAPVGRIDYNGYYSASGGYLAVIDTNYTDGLGAEFCSDLSQIQAFGWEENGLAENPLFEDPAQADFSLQEGSPAIDRGELIFGINDSWYQGDAPDLGAVESEGPNQALESGPSTAWSVYPNPGSGSIWIQFPESHIGTAEIFDVNGRLLALREGNFLELNLSQGEGVYWVRWKETGAIKKVLLLR
ncbi:MAG: right-handed parallel beta-helix repeat-containing protein [Saprospirales bacterium]|nr:right-handed parallel beta-helix repeat-containing protein [Saprospirales bacterium]